MLCRAGRRRGHSFCCCPNPSPWANPKSNLEQRASHITCQTWLQFFLACRTWCDYELEANKAMPCHESHRVQPRRVIAIRISAPYAAAEMKSFARLLVANEILAKRCGWYRVRVTVSDCFTWPTLFTMDIHKRRVPGPAVYLTLAMDSDRSAPSWVGGIILPLI